MLDIKKLYTKILDELLSVESLNSYSYSTNKTSATTTTSSTGIHSTTYTSATGKILVVGYGAIKTSANTSGLRITINGTSVASAITNNTGTEMQVPVVTIQTVTPNTSLTVALVLYSQNTSTTATMRAYNTYGLTIIDLPTIV